MRAIAALLVLGLTHCARVDTRGPCAVNDDPKCEVITCLNADGSIDVVTRTPLDDAGLGCSAPGVP